jgi:hypothetical protein
MMPKMVFNFLCEEFAFDSIRNDYVRLIIGDSDILVCLNDLLENFRRVDGL